MPELIDRNRLRETICAACAERLQCADIGNVCFEVACINNSPTIEAMQVKHGQWNKITGLEWDTEYLCSLCGHKTHMNVMPDQRDNWIDDYCGGCGAKMDGGTEK